MEIVNSRKQCQSGCSALMVCLARLSHYAQGWICIMFPCQFLHFSICHFHFNSAFSFFSGVDEGLQVREVEKLVTGSLNSCDQLGKSGWGKLMFNSLLCFNGYCQSANEQGTDCVSRYSTQSHTQQFKATSVYQCENAAGTLRKRSLDK